MGSNPLAGSPGIFAALTGAGAASALSTGAAPAYVGVCTVLLVGGFMRRRRDIREAGDRR